MTNTWNHDRHPVGHCPCKYWMRISKGKKKNLERILFKFDIDPFLNAECACEFDEIVLEDFCALQVCVRCGERMDEPSRFPKTFIEVLNRNVSKHPDIVFCEKCLTEDLGNPRFCSRCGFSAALEDYLQFHLAYAQDEEYPRIMRALLRKWHNPHDSIYCLECYVELMDKLGTMISYSSIEHF